MRQCIHCNGFVAQGMQSCPHCDAEFTVSTPKKPAHMFSGFRRMSWKQKTMTVVGTGAMMFTLMACYGGGPRFFCDEVDKDKDGYVTCQQGSTYELDPARVDCNDNDKNTYPGAPDVLGDGLDTNCDGKDG